MARRLRRLAVTTAALVTLFGFGAPVAHADPLDDLLPGYCVVAGDRDTDTHAYVCTPWY